MAFCTDCGTRIEGQERFCPQCGAPLESPRDGAAAVPRSERAARWVGARAGRVVARAVNPVLEQARAPQTPRLELHPGPYLVQLVDCGPRKGAVIAVVRATLSLSAREAKERVESAPVTLAEHLNEQTASALTARLRAAGAQADVAIDG